MLHDFDALRQFVTGPGVYAIFGLPWGPIFIVVIFSLHPLFDLLVAMALVNEPPIRRPLDRSSEAASRSFASRDDVNPSLRAAATRQVARTSGGLNGRVRTLSFGDSCDAERRFFYKPMTRASGSHSLARIMEPTSSRRRTSPQRTRTNDPDRTRAELLEVATEEFAAFGFSGARVDAIAERTRTSKRMIYYYFGGKEGLYLAVLEKAYADVRAIEAGLNLDELGPEDALRRLIEQTFEYDDTHVDFVRLVAIENIHYAKHLADAPSIRSINSRAIEVIERILARGRTAGLFRDDLDAVDVHMAISALCFFRVANRHTFGEIFRVDLTEPSRRAKHKKMIADAVVALLRIQSASVS